MIPGCTNVGVTPTSKELNKKAGEFILSLPGSKNLKLASYEEYQTLVRDKQQRFMIKITWLWLIPIAFVYVAGWSVGWIRRGFKKQQ